MGVFFGCYSKENPTCAKYAVLIYVFLFLMMAIMAGVCIGFEDTVRTKVNDEDKAFLNKFCDDDCYAEIQLKMEQGRSADETLMQHTESRPRGMPGRLCARKTRRTCTLPVTQRHRTVYRINQGQFASAPVTLLKLRLTSRRQQRNTLSPRL